MLKRGKVTEFVPTDCMLSLCSASESKLLGVHFPGKRLKEHAWEL
jgi:hypothetical protein